MAHYERVYAPNGEPFDVGPDRVADLVLHKGWTRSPTHDAGPEPEPRVTAVKQVRSPFDVASAQIESRGETMAPDHEPEPEEVEQ